MYFVQHRKYNESAFYRLQRSWAKVMFLQASVILSTGGGLPQCMLGYHHHPPPPGADTPRSTPPGTRHPPWEQTLRSRHPPGSRNPSRSRHPPGADTHPPPPPGSRLRDTVNELPVRILLECILVCGFFLHMPFLSGRAFLAKFLFV